MITRDAAHRYTYEGVVYPGVTGILNALDKSGPLMYWAAKQTATAAVLLAPELQKMVETTGEDGVIKMLSTRANWQRDEAAQLGTEVHGLADQLVRGQELPFMTPTQLARVEHYGRWWEGLLKGGAKLRLSEAMILRPNDPGNPESGWGGTFDLLYYDADGKTVLADIKTGGKWGRKVYESEVLQVTAYGMGTIVQPASDNVMVPATTYPMPQVDKYKVIHVTGEGCKPIDVDVTQRERMAFLACLDLHHWMEALRGPKAFSF